MEIDEFIDRFAKLAPRKKWWLVKDDCIRTADNECPITSFTGDDALHVHRVAESIDLSTHALAVIVTAADAACLHHPEIKSVREKLLAATGL